MIAPIRRPPNTRNGAYQPFHETSLSQRYHTTTLLGAALSEPSRVLDQTAPIYIQGLNTLAWRTPTQRRPSYGRDRCLTARRRFSATDWDTCGGTGRGEWAG